MKWSFLLFSSFLCLQAIAQYPATGNKMRLGWQTTGDGLVYRGAIGDTATLDPSGINNAWMLLDTANGNLYAYRAKAWRLVSGGGGSVSDTLTGEVKGPLDSTYIDTVANIIFDITTDTTAGVGELKYNDTQGSLVQGLKGGNVTNVIGQQIHQRVLNTTGAPLTKGTAVFLYGSQGNRITVRKALATVDSTSANTFGIVAESIADNQSGYVITEGLITNMNTNALTEGAAVYLSPTVAGELTTTKPQAPQHTVYIGVCVKQHTGSGELFIKIRNGQELDELHDVRIDSLASNASLYYNAAQGIWRDTGAAVLVADTAAMLTNYINIADTATMLSSYISNADTSVFARDFQISGTTNRLAMFTGSNTVGNGPISRQSDTLNFVNDAGYAAFRMVNTSGGSSSSTFAGWPIGTRYIGRFGGSYEGFSFGDNSGAPQNSAAMQITSWTGSFSNFYSTRFRVNSTGDFGLFLSPIATDANPTYSSTPHLMILNGGNVGIATSSPSRPLHVNANSSMIIPSGATGTRPAVGASGDIRFNSDSTVLEFYDGTGWRKPIVTNRGDGKGANGQFYIGDASGFADISSNLFWTSGKLAVNRTLPSSASDSTLYVEGGATITTGIRSRTLTGGTAANDTLILSGTTGTSNTATRTNIGFNVGDNSATRAMTILNNGRVGIGTTTPGVGYPASINPKLHIYGGGGGIRTSFVVEDTGYTSAARFSMVNAIGSQFSIQLSSPGFTFGRQATINTTDNTPVVLGTNGTLGSGGGGSVMFRTGGFTDAQIRLEHDSIGNTIMGGRYPKNRLDVKGATVIGDSYAGVNTAPANGLLVEGKVGIGTTSPTAVLHLLAGTASANTAPLKFTSGTNLTTAEAGAVEWNGTNVFVTNSGARRQTVNQGLTNSATMDFPNTDAQKSSDLTIAVTGALDGDVVSLGVPNAAVNANTCYTAWVSAADTVTIRFNNYSTGAINPASATFKVFVTKF